MRMILLLLVISCAACGQEAQQGATASTSTASTSTASTSTASTSTASTSTAPTSTAPTSTAPTSTAGTVTHTIPYPSGISWIGDIAYDTATKSLWMTAGDSTTLSSFINMDLYGKVLSQVTNTSFFINHGSEITFDGSNLWITAFGLTNGVKESKVFMVDLYGAVHKTIACPAAQAGGYCEGIAWDSYSQALWSGSSDNRNITQYLRDGSVLALMTNALALVPVNSTGINIIDDTSKSRLIILHNQTIVTMDVFTGNTSASRKGYVSMTSAWDGANLWQANNTTLTINAIFAGL